MKNTEKVWMRRAQSETVLNLEKKKATTGARVTIRLRREWATLNDIEKRKLEE